MKMKNAADGNISEDSSRANYIFVKYRNPLSPKWKVKGALSEIQRATEFRFKRAHFIL